MDEHTFSPIKLKDESWGVKVTPQKHLAEGDLVTVSTKAGKSYRSVIMRHITDWEAREGDDGNQMPGASIYKAQRLPDIKADKCPMCGQRIEIKSIESKAEPIPDQPRGVETGGLGTATIDEGFDDDIPF